MKHHYTIPTVGTILPAKEDTDITNPGPNATGNQRAQFNQQYAQHAAFKENELLAEDWLAEGGGWGRWLNEYKSGRMVGPKGPGDPDAPTPTPPVAKVVEVTQEEDGSINFEVVDGDEPVCEVPEYAKLLPPVYKNPTPAAPKKTTKKH